MIIYRSDNVLDGKHFTSDRGELRLNESDREIIERNCVGLSYYFAKSSEYEFENFLRFFLRTHADENRSDCLHLIFSNRFIEKKSRIRSHQKLFYQEQQLIGEHNYQEVELDLEQGQSIFIGVVQVTPENFAHCLERIYTSIFTFGLLIKEGNGVIFNSTFLEKIKNQYLELSNVRYFNPLKAVAGLQDKKYMLFQIVLHSNNDQSVDVLLEKELQSEYLEIGQEFTDQSKAIIYN